MAEFGNREMRGVIPPMITPFKKDGDLDKVAVRELVSFLKKRVHGLFVAGTYGCGPLMSVEERKELLELVMEEAGKEIQVCVHIGSTSTKDALDLGMHAAKLGVVGVASVPPYYFHYSEQDVEAYFETLIGEIPVPFYFYNNPATTHFSASSALIARLARKGLKGIKDSSFDILTFYSFVCDVQEEGFHFIIGSEALIVPARLLGARGTIAGLANCLPEEITALWQAAEANDTYTSSELQKRVLKIRQIYKSGPTLALIHRTLRERGVNAGYPRAPFRDVSDEQWSAFKSKLRDFGGGV